MRVKMLTLSHKEHIMKTVFSRLLLLCALLCAAGTLTAKTGFWGRMFEPKVSFKITLKPHSYKAYSY